MELEFLMKSLALGLGEDHFFYSFLAATATVTYFNFKRIAVDRCNGGDIPYYIDVFEYIFINRN